MEEGDFGAAGTLVQAHIDRGGIAGAVLSFGNCDWIGTTAFGLRSLHPETRPVTPDTVYDLASLTKVLATWPVVMRLIGSGIASTETTIGDVLPGASPDMSGVSIGNLLTHTAGIQQPTWLRQYGDDLPAIQGGVLRAPLAEPRGTKVAYSNRGFVVLGWMAEKLGGIGLDVLTARLHRDLGIDGLSFGPLSECAKPCAPTELRNDRWLCGEVHDENAEVLGGVAGHAGLFGDGASVGQFSSAVLSVLTGDAIWLPQDLVIDSFQPVAVSESGQARGLAWGILVDDMRGSPTPVAFHHGFTGTSIWLNLGSNEFVALLTNRVHPTRTAPSSISSLRLQIPAAVWSDLPRIRPAGM